MPVRFVAVGLERDYRRSTRGLGPLFLVALVVLLLAVVWRSLAGGP